MTNPRIGLGSLLREVFITLLANPVILYPAFVLGFIQLLFLEIIYFIPRYPLSILFGPLILKTGGAAFLHYPFNYLLLSRWFHGFDIFISIFVSCIFYAATVLIISSINSGEPVNLKKVFQRVFSSYVHLVLAMALGVLLFQGLAFLLGLVLKRALAIHSTIGIYFLIKNVVVTSTPYLQLLMACMVTALFAFVVPIIVLGQEKIIAAVKLNFTNYGRLLGVVLGVVIISGLLYLPFIFLRSTEAILQAPEVFGFLLVLSVLAMLFINVIQYTAFTLCYLTVKEASS